MYNLMYFNNMMQLYMHGDHNLFMYLVLYEFAHLDFLKCAYARRNEKGMWALPERRDVKNLRLAIVCFEASSDE